MINVLGVAREGVRRFGGLKNWRFAAGDVLLLQGEGDRIDDAIGRLGLLPLATRDLGLGPRPGALFVIAVVIAALVALAFGLAPAAVRSEEHTSELQSLMRSSYAVFCLKTKNIEHIATK